jgi:hypothetical protein
MAADKANQSGMTLGWLESASFWSQIATVAFGLLAAGAAVLALYFTLRRDAVKDAELSRYQDASRISIANADEKAAEANLKAAQANERASRLELDAAAQRERAAKAEKDLVEVRQTLTDRSLRDDQQKAITEKLKHFPGTRLDVFIYGGSPEIVGTAKLLMTICANAGWTVNAWTATGGGAVKGILLGTAPGAPTDTIGAATVLTEALQQNGLVASRADVFAIPVPPMLVGAPWSAEKCAPMRLLVGAKR